MWIHIMLLNKLMQIFLRLFIVMLQGRLRFIFVWGRIVWGKIGGSLFNCIPFFCSTMP